MRAGNRSKTYRRAIIALAILMAATMVPMTAYGLMQGRRGGGGGGRRPQRLDNSVRLNQGGYNQKAQRQPRARAGGLEQGRYRPGSSSRPTYRVNRTGDMSLAPGTAFNRGSRYTPAGSIRTASSYENFR